VVEFQLGELWTLALVVFMLSYRPPPPHQSALFIMPRHDIMEPYALYLGLSHAYSTHGHSLYLISYYSLCQFLKFIPAAIQEICVRLNGLDVVRLFQQSVYVVVMSEVIKKDL